MFHPQIKGTGWGGRCRDQRSAEVTVSQSITFLDSPLSSPTCGECRHIESAVKKALTAELNKELRGVRLWREL